MAENLNFSVAGQLEDVVYATAAELAKLPYQVYVIMFCKTHGTVEQTGVDFSAA